MRKQPWLGADGLLKSSLKLLGSKQGQCKESARRVVYSLLPARIDYYVEPFAGALNLLVGRPPCCAEVAGDTNPFIVNYFKQMQAQPGVLWRRLSSEFEEQMSAERYDLLKSARLDDGIDKAVWFYLISRYANNGIVRFNRDGICNSTYCKSNTGRGLLTLEYFLKVFERIQNIDFRECDYSDILEDLLETYSDLTGLVIVCDPPYMSTEENPGTFRNYWDAPFSMNEQKNLAAMLDKLGKRGACCLVTLNDCPEARDIYGRYGFKFHEHQVHYACSNTTKGRGLRDELVILNYEPPSILPLYLRNGNEHP